MDRVAIGVDRGTANAAVFSLHVMRFLRRLGSSTDCFRKRLIRVVHFQRDIPHAIAVLSDVIRRQIVRRHGRSRNEVRLALTQRIRSSLPLARFQPAISNLRKAESLAIEVSRLPSIAYPEFDVMNALKLEWILHPRSPGFHLRIFCPQSASSLRSEFPVFCSRFRARIRGTLLQDTLDSDEYFRAAHHLPRRYGRLLRVRRGIV